LPSASRTSASSCDRCRPTPFEFAGARPVGVPLDGYLKLAGSFYRAPLALVDRRVEPRFDRDQVWIADGQSVARYRRSYEHGP
jgi:hypothetical protein